MVGALGGTRGRDITTLCISWAGFKLKTEQVKASYTASMRCETRAMADYACIEAAVYRGPLSVTKCQRPAWVRFSIALALPDTPISRTQLLLLHIRSP